MVGDELSSVVIGHRLAKNAGVSDTEAFRLAFVASKIARGLYGPIFAQHLAKRKAGEAQPIIAPRPPSTPDKQDHLALVNDAIRNLNQAGNETKNAVDELRKEAVAAHAKADELQKKHTDALEKLCEGINQLKDKPKGKNNGAGKDNPEAAAGKDRPE